MKYYIFTFGCVLNKSDSERIAYVLEKKGYTPSNTPEEADIIIINTCAVKQPAENKAIKIAEEYKKKGKEIIITGCLLYNPKLFKEYKKFTPYDIERIPEGKSDTIYYCFKECILKREKDKFFYKDKEISSKDFFNLFKKYKYGIEKDVFGYKKINKLKINRKSFHKVIEIIPIQEGCLYKQCTFCAGKFARPIFFSYPLEDILYWIEKGIEEGKRIFYLTGMDISSYGLDLGISILDLMKEITKIKEEIYVRFGMANPFYLKNILDKFLDFMANEKFFKFFHIPVQSGSNKVLKDMKRPYTVEEYIDMIQKIRNRFKCSIATDIIVGYPTETENDFRKTLELVKNLKFDIINISRFWPRPFTEASYLKQLPGNIIKDRSRRLTKVFNESARERNKEWVGWEGVCIVEDRGRKENSWICRNFAYKQIIVKSEKDILGKKIYVKINSYTHVDLRGELIEIID